MSSSELLLVRLNTEINWSEEEEIIAMGNLMLFQLEMKWKLNFHLLNYDEWGTDMSLYGLLQVNRKIFSSCIYIHEWNMKKSLRPLSVCLFLLFFHFSIMTRTGVCACVVLTLKRRDTLFQLTSIGWRSRTKNSCIRNKCGYTWNSWWIIRSNWTGHHHQ